MFPNPEIFGVKLEWYSLWQFLAIAFTIFFGLFYIFIKKSIKLESSKFFILCAVLVSVGYCGAKLFSALDYITTFKINLDFESLFANLVRGNLRWYGALLMIVLFLPILSKFSKKNIQQYFDFIVLKLCLYTAIVKQSCFFSGDGCYGTFTNLPWGMYFLHGSEPNFLPVHPAPLYDSIFHFIFFIFLYKWNDIKKYDGQTTIIFLSGTAIFNVFLELIKRNPEILVGLTLPQITYLLIIFITLFYYFQIKKLDVDLNF